jgi:hypothetical protein
LYYVQDDLIPENLEFDCFMLDCETEVDDIRRREKSMFAEMPRRVHTFCFQGISLGFIKNVVVGLEISPISFFDLINSGLE